MLNFIAWYYHSTQTNFNLTSRAITAAISVYKDDGISFDKKQYTSIRRILDGFQSLGPLASSEHYFHQIFIYCVGVNEHESLLPGCAMLIGHSLLLRPVEMRYQPRSDEKNLYVESITRHPKFENAR